METTDRLDRWIPRAMVLAVLAVAVFAFVQSYTHGFYWGQTHHQSGTSLRMFPLVADWIMFAAGLTMLHLGRKGISHPLPRAALVLGATVTLAINIAAGIIWGWETALTNSWAPVALFVVVELGMLLVRTAKAKAEPAKELRLLEDGPVAGPSVETMQRIITNLPTEKSPRPQMPTELRRPQSSPEPSPDTATMPKAVDTPQQALEGWGQLAGQEPAGQPESLERRPGPNGIGLRNRGQ
jgi:hypothetical protein